MNEMTPSDAKKLGYTGWMCRVRVDTRGDKPLDPNAFMDDLRDMLMKHGIASMRLGYLGVDEDGFVILEGSDIIRDVSGSTAAIEPPHEAKEPSL